MVVCLLLVPIDLQHATRRQIIEKKVDDETEEMNGITEVEAEAGVEAEVIVGVVVIIVIEADMIIDIAVRGTDGIGTAVINIEREIVTGTATEVVIGVIVMGEGGVRMASIGIIRMTETVVTIVIVVVGIVTINILRVTHRIPKNLLLAVSLHLLITNPHKKQMTELLRNQTGQKLLVQALLDRSVQVVAVIIKVKILTTDKSLIRLTLEAVRINLILVNYLEAMM